MKFAFSVFASVVLSRNAALFSLIWAVNSHVPLRLNLISLKLMETVNCLRWVKYKMERRLVLRSGTCNTHENSTALVVLPLIVGTNTTVPIPTEYTIRLFARWIGPLLKTLPWLWSCLSRQGAWESAIGTCIHQVEIELESWNGVHHLNPWVC